MDGNNLRIGELAKRVGISPDVLRAWERRYRLVRPTRTGGGHRLYSTEDERRIRQVLRHIAAGMSVASAAEHVLTATESRDNSATEFADGLAEQTAELTRALDALDDALAQAVLDRLLAEYGLRDALTGAILPYLQTLGARWERGEASIATEHFASALIRGRLLALARGWNDGDGPSVVLACPSGELHEIALIALGLMLREQGWRVTYLGPDVSIETIRATSEARSPDAVVLAATRQEHFERAAEDAAALAQSASVFAAGPGATADVAASLCASILPGDPVQAAERLTELAQNDELER